MYAIFLKISGFKDFEYDMNMDVVDMDMVDMDIVDMDMVDLQVADLSSPMWSS